MTPHDGTWFNFDAWLILEGTGVSEYSKPWTLALVAQILKTVSESLDGRKAIIVFPNSEKKSIVSDTIGLSLRDGKVILNTKKDMDRELDGDNIYGFPWTIHVHCRDENGDEVKLDINGIKEIIIARVIRATDSKGSPPPWIPERRRKYKTSAPIAPKPIAPELVEA